MGDILIRNLPEPLKIELKIASARSGRSLSEEAKAALARGLGSTVPAGGQQSALTMFRSAFADALMTDREHADLDLDLVQLRKSGDRPAPDFE